MKPIENKMKAFKLLMRTNEFVLILSKRYGIEDSELIANHIVKFDMLKMKSPQPTVSGFNIDMLLLNNIGFGMNYNSKIKSMVESDMRSIGVIREYLFSSIENVKRCETMTDAVMNAHIHHVNKQYKEYLKYITDNNLLKDFLTLTYVTDAYKNYASDFNRENMETVRFMRVFF
jgi:hypothetical protein